jgi:hypothetical protein
LEFPITFLQIYAMGPPTKSAGTLDAYRLAKSAAALDVVPGVSAMDRFNYIKDSVAVGLLLELWQPVSQRTWWYALPSEMPQ